MKRFVIIDIDTLVAILKDYLGGDHLPADAAPVRFRIAPSTRRMEIELESDSLPQDRTLTVDFQIKRFFAGGGVA